MAVLDASTEVGLKVNADKIIYIPVSLLQWKTIIIEIANNPSKMW
jgi:hypothetical protein